MNTKKLHYLAWLTMGMAVCLTTSSCTTCDDATLYAVNKQGDPTQATIPPDDANCLIQVPHGAESEGTAIIRIVNTLQLRKKHATFGSIDHLL